MKTVAQCAEAWDVHRQTVYGWIKRGMVRHMMLPVTGTIVVIGDKPVTRPRGRPRKSRAA